MPPKVFGIPFIAPEPRLETTWIAGVYNMSCVLLILGGCEVHKSASNMK